MLTLSMCYLATDDMITKADRDWLSLKAGKRIRFEEQGILSILLGCEVELSQKWRE